MPHLLILSEAGFAWGTGHLNRCQALSLAFEKLGWSTRLVIQTDSAKFHCSFGHKALWHADPEAWFPEAQSADLVLMDSYQASIQTIDAIATVATKFAVIDDFPRRDYQHGIVIDWSLEAENYAYPSRHKQVTYLLGCKYTCLRPAFWTTRPRCPATAKRILVVFGGSDIRDLTRKTVETLIGSNPDFVVDVVIGNRTATEPLKNDRVKVHLAIDADAMLQLMLRCDIAVTGGGQTLYELAACGVPAIAIELAENQHDDLRCFATAGLIDFVGSWHDENLWGKVMSAIKHLCEAPEELSRRAQRSQDLIDGQGALRLASELAILVEADRPFIPALAESTTHMDTPNIRGLKYPDEFIIRFFFKSAHHSRTGRVVELGCGDGNNLMLYRSYGWKVTGVDISPEALDNARHNMGGDGCFIQHDLSDGIPENIECPIDVLLMPYSLCYIPRTAFLACLQMLAPLLAPNADIFISLRTPEDYRYSRGTPAEPNGFILNTTETGENGLLNVFYHEHEVVDMLKTGLGMATKDLTVLHCHFDNIQANRLITGNSDLVVWGKRP